MVTNLKHAKENLEEGQNQLQSIIRNAMDGIITIDESGKIQEFNPAAEQIFGYAQEEVSSKNVRMQLPGPDQSGHDAHISRYLQTARVVCSACADAK